MYLVKQGTVVGVRTPKNKEVKTIKTTKDNYFEAGKCNELGWNVKLQSFLYTFEQDGFWLIVRESDVWVEQQGRGWVSKNTAL